MIGVCKVSVSFVGILWPLSLLLKAIAADAIAMPYDGYYGYL